MRNEFHISRKKVLVSRNFVFRETGFSMRKSVSYVSSNEKTVLRRRSQSRWSLNYFIPESLLSCIPPVLNPSSPESLLYFISSCLHPSCPASFLYCILPVLHPSFPVSHLSCIPSVLHPTCHVSHLYLRSSISPVLNSFFPVSLFSFILPVLNPSSLESFLSYIPLSRILPFFYNYIPFYPSSFPDMRVCLKIYG